MGGEKGRDRRIGLVFVAGLGGLLLVLLAPNVYSELLANIQRVRTLRGPDLPGHGQSLDEVAWDSGWQSLCPTGQGAEPNPVLQGKRTLDFSASASLERGDYVAALGLLRRLEDQEAVNHEPNALAYSAALEMDWVEAARSYEPQATPRHERWWGTVFYLAAQKLMFEGELDEAGELYRRADAAYGLHGPYLGLGLVECLVQRGRFLEAWDAYRRALVVMPPEEAQGHLPRFDELRREGLRAWHELDPENEQVERWLAFYEDASGRESSGAEALGEEPAPELPLELDLGDGRALIGFDYQVQDLETGPFMEVDFYVREGEGDQVDYRRVRRTVLNQAPNGAFAWDRVPDGVRPVGWHAFVYGPELVALSWEEMSPGKAWLCLDARPVGKSFGLQGSTVPLGHEEVVYIQGGGAFLSGAGALVLGRTWFGVQDPNNYSYVPGGRQPDRVQSMVGSWNPATGANSAAVWLVAIQGSSGCFRELYLFSILSDL